MPIQHGLWRIDGDQPKTLRAGKLENEKQLEELICKDPKLLDPGWMLIGRQVLTDHGKLVDLLALDAAGSLIVIELKKEKTPREVVAQVLDYGAWARDLGAAEISEVFRSSPFSNNGNRLDAAFKARFDADLDEDSLNQRHELVIVASSLDAATERIVAYLADSSVAINALFFQVFADGDHRYLSRTWLLDPATNQDKTTAKKDDEPWNGEFYVSFGDAHDMRWEDARKYGFICASGGLWYTRTLSLLKPGHRVWVNVPKQGYVGVGRVTREACRIDEFDLSADADTLLNVETTGDYGSPDLVSGETALVAVGVKWERDLDLGSAVKEVGFFGNQNTVARPVAAKWRHTVKRLKEIWNLKDPQ